MIKHIIKYYNELISNIHNNFLNIQNNMHFTNYTNTKIKINKSEFILWSICLFIIFITIIFAFVETQYIMTFIK